MAAVPSVNITIERGTDFESSFDMFTDSGRDIDISDYTGVAKVRKYPTSPSYTNFTVSISSDNRISMSMSAEDTATLEEGRNYYDLVLKSPTNLYTKVIEGMALVSPTVSQ